MTDLDEEDLGLDVRTLTSRQIADVSRLIRTFGSLRDLTLGVVELYDADGDPLGAQLARDGDGGDWTLRYRPLDLDGDEP